MKIRWTLAALALSGMAAACKPQEQAAPPAPAGPEPGTTEWKIQNAMSAAPAAVAAAAAVLETPTSPDSQPRELRAGTNGWTCLTDNPGSPGNDPMCVDQQFWNWAGAWLSRRTPNITGVGIGYMLQGGSDASNTDPFKMQPDSGQPWVDTGPHVMVVVPNVRALADLPTDHSSGGPYVMWQNTPYAHIMVPIRPARTP
jgi:hypothetical protein